MPKFLARAHQKWKKSVWCISHFPFLNRWVLLENLRWVLLENLRCVRLLFHFLFKTRLNHHTFLVNFFCFGSVGCHFRNFTLLLGCFCICNFSKHQKVEKELKSNFQSSSSSKKSESHNFWRNELSCITKYVYLKKLDFALKVHRRESRRREEKKLIYGIFKRQTVVILHNCMLN